MFNYSFNDEDRYPDDQIEPVVQLVGWDQSRSTRSLHEWIQELILLDTESSSASTWKMFQFWDLM